MDKVTKMARAERPTFHDDVWPKWESYEDATSWRSPIFAAGSGCVNVEKRDSREIYGK
jgi:hypothetical protein